MKASKSEVIIDLIKNWNTSGTNSKHDPAFKSFTSLFKSFIKTELEKVNVTNVVFSVGHYHISGFFTVGKQSYYFSLSDVRHGFDRDRILVRTAKDYNDYRGGSNNFITIREDMFKKWFSGITEID